MPRRDTAPPWSLRMLLFLCWSGCACVCPLRMDAGLAAGCPWSPYDEKVTAVEDPWAALAYHSDCLGVGGGKAYKY